MEWSSNCGKARLILGDCLERLKELPDCSVDAVVTDPPYGLAFMGKRWDYDVPSVEVWQQCLRVLKPGGHLLAFAGTRTQHRMAVRIEDAGFEIRDMIAWVYGSGFPKSLDVSKAIDKRYGENRERKLQFTAWMRTTGITAEQINEATSSCMASHYLTDKSQPAIATADMFDRLRPYLPEVPEYIERLVCERTGLEWTAYKQREVIGQRRQRANNTSTSSAPMNASTGEMELITAPATDAAKQWQGWGTALKPALEPITVARKPLIGTVAENVLAHGTGALNIDGCRVATDPSVDDPRLGGKGAWKTDKAAQNVYEGGYAGKDISSSALGRWPANLIHDGSDEVVGLFPDRDGGAFPAARGCNAVYGKTSGGSGRVGPMADSGSAARFFYCAKASKADRDAGCDGLEYRTAGEMVDREEGSAGIQNPRAGAGRTGGARNHHPTVKPVSLMRYLCRLITPPGGIVLDPFMGSGSTGKGAILEGFRFIGIEREAEYLEIAKARIAYAIANYEPPKDRPEQLTLLPE